MKKEKRYSVSETCLCFLVGCSCFAVIVAILFASAAIVNKNETSKVVKQLSDTKIALVQAEEQADNWKLEAYKAQNKLKSLGYED